MKTLAEVQENFRKNLQMIDQIVNIGSDTGNILVSILEDLQQRNSSQLGCHTYKDGLSRAIQTVKTVKDHDQLKAKYEIIRNQAIVLVVQNFESFLNDCVRTLVNEHPWSLTWPAKKFHIDTDILRYSVPTVGDLVVESLKKDNTSFQDLQSIVRFFKEYFDFEIVFADGQKDKIVFSHALRNIVIHNGGLVDPAFLSQIRDTVNAQKYKDKDQVLLSEFEYKDLVEQFLELSNLIITKLESRIFGGGI